MSSDTRDVLMRQLDTAWKLTQVHLTGLTTVECLWRPADKGLHVRQGVVDWPGRESYDLGPPSIAWITWHIGFWWSMVLDHSFGNAVLMRDQVTWPGSADAVRHWLEQLHARWRREVNALTAADFLSTSHTRWPFERRPFADVAAWVNLELTKNAAEIGYVRFLFAVRKA